MGRELRRKQAKRDGKNVREVQKKNADKVDFSSVFYFAQIFICKTCIIWNSS